MTGLRCYNSPEMNGAEAEGSRSKEGSRGEAARRRAGSSRPMCLQNACLAFFPSGTRCSTPVGLTMRCIVWSSRRQGSGTTFLEPRPPLVNPLTRS